VSLLSEALVISGIAMDLVGATVLSHAHNAEYMVDIREEIGAEKSALGEKDAFATQAQPLAEKRQLLRTPAGWPLRTIIAALA
jgi:hypothetical protein